LGILSVIGGVLIHFTYGHFYTIGNLITYITSYIKQKVDPDFNTGSAVWISAIALAVQGISMPLGGALLPKIGYRAVVIIGSAINSGSVLLTYITIQKGFAYVVLSYAVLLGFGFGFSYAVIFSVAASWFPARRGLIVGIIVGGFGLGALVFTPIQTAFINPNNVAINQTTGQSISVPKLLVTVSPLFLSHIVSLGPLFGGCLPDKCNTFRFR
uniref:MFS domain-containing protein n=1 Tax=Schistocephalus solidus TaxID=70667 RepID=A0A183T0V7_SCHSO